LTLPSLRFSWIWNEVFWKILIHTWPWNKRDKSGKNKGKPV
jgi:hypothetical protein